MPQYAILRFAKYKGPEISNIEAHNERTKEKYASNPDVDMSRSNLNYHMIEPSAKYRAESERQIAEAGCRTRKDSVRVVETLVTASPEFFKGKKKVEIRAFFEEAVHFIEKHQSKETIISAVVHMDEKTPHMHLSFVPLTNDNRLCAKDILGNRKKLIWWQDEFWKHMVRKFPDLERGKSASETGRDHIPPRIFKEATRLNREFEAIMQTVSEVNPFNARAKSEKIAKKLEGFAPRYESYLTQVKKYDKAFKKLKSDNVSLAKEAEANKESSVKRRMEISQQLADYENLCRNVERHAPELLKTSHINNKNKKFER